MTSRIAVRARTGFAGNGIGGYRHPAKHAKVTDMFDVPRSTTFLAEEVLLGRLLPFWQLVIGILVLFAVLAGIQRLARRGPSRMTTALLVTAAAIFGLALLGVLLQEA